MNSIDNHTLFLSITSTINSVLTGGEFVIHPDIGHPKIEKQSLPCESQVKFTYEKSRFSISDSFEMKTSEGMMRFLNSSQPDVSFSYIFDYGDSGCDVVQIKYQYALSQDLVEMFELPKEIDLTRKGIMFGTDFWLPDEYMNLIVIDVNELFATLDHLTVQFIEHAIQKGKNDELKKEIFIYCKSPYVMYSLYTDF